MHSLPYNHQDRELIQASGRRHSKIDATKARQWLTSLAAVLEYAAESTDPRELLAGIDLVRRAPGMLPGLEV